MRNACLPQQPAPADEAAMRAELAEAVLPALEVRALRAEVCRRLHALLSAEGRALREHAQRLYDLLLDETCQPALADFLRANQARHAVWRCLQRWPMAGIDEGGPCTAPRAA
jgi:hypothetical protein